MWINQCCSLRFGSGVIHVWIVLIMFVVGTFLVWMLLSLSLFFLFSFSSSLVECAQLLLCFLVSLCCCFGVPFFCFVQIFCHSDSIFVAITNIVHRITVPQLCTFFVPLKSFGVIFITSKSGWFISQSGLSNSPKKPKSRFVVQQDVLY